MLDVTHRKTAKIDGGFLVSWLSRFSPLECCINSQRNFSSFQHKRVFQSREKEYVFMANRRERKKREKKKNYGATIKHKKIWPGMKAGEE